MFECDVAVAVIESVVDALEVVEVENDVRARMTESLRTVDFFVELLFEVPAVIQSCQRIRNSLTLDLFKSSLCAITTATLLRRS